MSKTIHTLVDDIYRLIETKEAEESLDVEAEIELFGENMKTLMRTEFGRKRTTDRRTLRLSNIGRDDRVLWNVVNGTEKEEIKPATYIKFMYGHLIEEMLLFMTRMAGHEVSDEQRVCEVEGIKGHMDCKIDGLVVDVKSASAFGFKKFKDGTLAMDDAFGYVDQIKDDDNAVFLNTISSYNEDLNEKFKSTTERLDKLFGTKWEDIVK